MSIHSFSLMMEQLNIKSYKETKDKNKFENELLVGAGDKIDYNLLQACLNVYKPIEKSSENVQVAILSTLLSAFKQKVDRVVDFLDIDGNKSISRSEFVQGVKKYVQNYPDVR